VEKSFLFFRVQKHKFIIAKQKGLKYYSQKVCRRIDVLEGGYMKNKFEFRE
jgi:hypothetical protein